MSTRVKTPPHPRKAIVSTIERLGQSHGMRRVWEDWIEAMALWAVNTCGRAHPSFQDETWHSREARYTKIQAHYTGEEWRELTRMLPLLIDLLEREALAGGSDPLGELFMTLELGNDRAGQYFTPWDLCKVNARLLAGAGEGSVFATIDDRGHATIGDPACGSGTMLLAFAEVVREAGYNPQRQTWYHGRDLSSTAAHMAIVNLTLRGLPGIIEQGNSLTLELFGTWMSPWHVFGGWAHRLRREPVLQPRAELAEIAGVIDRVQQLTASPAPMRPSSSCDFLMREPLRGEPEVLR